MHDLDFKETKTKLKMAVVNGWDVFAGRCHTTSEVVRIILRALQVP